MTSRSVNRRHVPITTTVPAGTTAAAPQVQTFDFTNQQLLSLHLVIPNGHAGLTGIRLDMSGTTILPWSNPSQWIVGDGLDKEFPLDVEGAALMKVLAYNTDTIPHTFYGWLYVTDLDTKPSAGVQLVPITAN